MLSTATICWAVAASHSCAFSLYSALSALPICSPNNFHNLIQADGKAQRHNINFLLSNHSCCVRNCNPEAISIHLHFVQKILFSTFCLETKGRAKNSRTTQSLRVFVRLTHSKSHYSLFTSKCLLNSQ